MAKILKNPDGKILKRRNIWSYFNGTSSYISYADNDKFSFTDGVNDLPFEVEFDIFITVANANNWIISKRDGTASLCEWTVTFSTQKIRISLFTNDTSNYLIKTTSTALNLNTNYKVKITYDGSKTLGGIKIYFNNILQTTADLTLGSYTGMVNTDATLQVGRYYGNSLYLNGYLRNLKITKNNQLVFFAPLQDPSAVSKDVISGLVHNAGTLPVVTDINENGNWAYIKTTSSSDGMAIGTTSTLGWMNSGVFNFSFDIKFINMGSYHRPIWNSTSTGYGFFFYMVNTTRMYIYWVANSGYAAFFGPTSLVYGTNYNITVQGNGTHLRMIWINNDTGVGYYDSGWVVCNYIPNATTSSTLNFAMYSTPNFQIRNFKIFTDTAGTIPFMSLPLQTNENLMLDIVGGLQGVAQNVQVINNNTNVLRPKDIAAYFDSAIATHKIYPVGANTTLTWFHTTFIGRIEFEAYILSDCPNSAVLFITNGGPATRGFQIYKSSGGISVILSNASGTYVVNQNDAMSYDAWHKVILVFTGTRYNCYIDNILVTDVALVGAVVVGNTYSALAIGNSSSPSFPFKGYLKNLKFYRSSDKSDLAYHFPLQNTGTISKDVITGLVGTVVNANVREI